MPGFEGTIETVRGGLGEERSEQLLRFWSESGALDEAAGRERLGEVVCILLDGDGDGAVAGVNSVYADAVAPVGSRRFWIYRRFLLPAAEGEEAAMINAAFEALDEEFDSSGPGPIGLCVLVDEATAAGRPEVIWPETGLMLAGYTADGRQVRVRYFEDAQIGPGMPNSPGVNETSADRWPLEKPYRLEPFGGTGTVTEDDVLEFWRSEDAMPEEEAKRRVGEVHLVGVDGDKGVAAVSSAYLRRHPQLQMDMLHYRAFVGREHRKSSLAAQIAIRGREVLEERYISGEDRSAPGIIWEVENPGLKTYFNRALWKTMGFTFIGETRSGAFVRVHYFAGAVVPPLGG
jgi:hypothetical protein